MIIFNYSLKKPKSKITKKQNKKIFLFYFDIICETTSKIKNVFLEFTN